jgi:prepilin-type N-terminal cleavage/methylation domain-containing protein
MPFRKTNGQLGFTLVELMVAVAIVIILAAISIPVFSRHVREASLSEAASNLQGILEAEQAYFVRFQRYTAALPACPLAAAPQGQNQDWVLTDCNAGWQILGWNPEKRVYFQYQVFSLYDAAGVRAVLPGTLPQSTAWGIDWDVEFPQDNPTNMEPWVAVQAWADTDGDGEPVFFRSNSYNHATFRCNQAGDPPPGADPTY